MKIISEQNIGRVSFLFAAIVVSIIIFTVGIFFVVGSYEASLEELARVERGLVEDEQVRLKADVESMLLRIQSLREASAATLQAERDARQGVETGGVVEEPSQSDTAAKQHVLDALNRAADLESAGYFIYDLHNPDGGEGFATMLFNPARADLVGQLLSTEYPDARGFNFRKVFVKDIRDRGESFVTYHYHKETAAEDTSGNEKGVAANAAIGRKLTYFRADHEWSWVVAKSTRLDRIDRFSADRLAALHRENRNNLLILGLIFSGGIILSLILAYLLSAGMQPLFEHHRVKEDEVRTRNEFLQKTLEQQNRTDRLTSAFNRGHLNQELIKEIARSRRYQTPLSMVLFDIDDFRTINDRFGCEAGDTVLVEMVALVTDNIRQTDLLARWGGEEFAVLAPGIDLDHGRKFAEKLRTLIEAHSFSIAQRVTCSFGFGCFASQEEKHLFVQRVEDALNRAKADGKNRCAAA